MLRPVTETDLPSFYEHQLDPQACRMAAFKPRALDAFMNHWRENVLGRSTVRTIVAGEQVTGYVASFTQENARLACYWLGRAFWGRGLATTALAEFIEHVERTRPLDAFVATSNVGSIRVLEKAGFTLVPNSKETGEDGVEEVRYRLTAPAPP